MTDKPKMKRVVVYIEDENYNKLRAALILQHTSVSYWVREKIKEFLNAERG